MRRVLAALCFSALFAIPAGATTTTSTFGVSLTVQASCQVTSNNSLNFGTAGVLSSNVDTTATMSVQCTNTTPYNVGLNAGATSGGSVTTRLLNNGGTTVAYKIFSDSSRSTNWGNTVGTDTVSGTGNGSAQTLTMYGRVTPQSTPAPGTYTDTVTVTVTY